MTKHPSSAVPGVLDMSVGPDNHIRSASIYVGPGRRHFVLLRQVLNKRSINLSLLLQKCGVSQDNNPDVTDFLKDLELDKVDPEAFNLFTQWLYGFELPQVQLVWPQATTLSTRNGRLHQVPLPAELEISGALEGLVQNGNPTGSEKDRFIHIVFHDSYRQFSPEEIRVADMIRLSNTPSTTMMDMNPPSTDQSLPERAATEETNESTQTVLLKLMLLADMAGWKECFNDALNSYRLGESQIKRDSMNLDHIALAYSTIASVRLVSESSPTLHFMADYAYFKGTEHGLLTVYQELFVKFPRFLDDIRLREKGILQVPGMNRDRSGGSQVATLLGRQRGPLGIHGRYQVS